MDKKKARRLGWVIALVIRVLGATLRIRIDDRARMLETPPGEPLIWVFWHNRILVMPYIYRRYLRSRRGAVLTSASGDGELIAQVMELFGVEAVRGSSSKRGTGAMLGMVETVNRGEDVVVTPDGPRGPCYVLHPGLIRLAQITRAKVFPVHLRYSCAWRLKTWDGFRVPWPFSRVDVVFDTLREIPDTDDDGTFEEERVALEKVLADGAAD